MLHFRLALGPWPLLGKAWGRFLRLILLYLAYSMLSLRDMPHVSKRQV